jgi:hypothetical protein
MPCYQVITASVEFKVGNIDLLKKAITKMGCRVFQESDVGIYFRDNANNSMVISFKDQKITGTKNQTELAKTANSIKRAYSEQVIDEIAKRQHWLKKKTGEGQYQLQRY